MGRWQEIDHTADLAVRVWGEDLADLFAEAARAMFHLAIRPDEAGGPATRDVALEAPDPETLLVDWLNELLYLSEVDRAVYLEAEFAECTPTRLKARLVGQPIEERRRSIKAATFHALEIVECGGGWMTEVVFDV